WAVQRRHSLHRPWPARLPFLLWRGHFRPYCYCCGSSLAAHQERSGGTGQLVRGGHVQQPVAHVCNVDQEVVGFERAWNEVAVGADDLGGGGGGEPVDHLTFQGIIELLKRREFLYARVDVQPWIFMGLGGDCGIEQHV